jgi:hypothetical protein
MASMGSTLRSLLLSNVALLAILGSVGCGPSKHVQQRRESAYRQTLRSYSEALSPGTTREVVEEYLQQKDSSFRQKHPSSDAPDITIQIGRDTAPWFCSGRPVLLLFHFSAADTGKSAKPSPSDTLQNITIVRGFGECV